MFLIDEFKSKIIWIEYVKYGPQFALDRDVFVSC